MDQETVTKDSDVASPPTFWRMAAAGLVLAIIAWAIGSRWRDSPAPPLSEPLPPTAGVVVAPPPGATASAGSRSAALASSAVSAWLATGTGTPASAAHPPHDESKRPRLETLHGDPDRWTPVKDLRVIAGLWVGAEKGDAIPDGSKGGKLVDGGFRAVFVHKKVKSRTPWNVTVWPPADGHRGSDTVSFGCGFYDDIHEPEMQAWRVGYCKGYGFSNAKPVNVLLATHAGHLRLSVLQQEPLLVFHAVLLRPEHGE